MLLTAGSKLGYAGETIDPKDGKEIGNGCLGTEKDPPISATRC